MPVPPVQQPVALVNPIPTKDPSSDPREGRRLPHQQFETLFQDPQRPVTMYEVRQQEFLHSFHPDLPLQPVWGFNGHSPGPVYHARYGRPVILRNWNLLPEVSDKAPKVPEKAKVYEFGCHFVSTHLHNGHTAPESDGNRGISGRTACFMISATRTSMRGTTWIRASGMASLRRVIPAALGTLWYHDHMHDATAANVYKGLTGMFLLFDELDSGNELDWNPMALRLPSGGNDVPILLTDKAFDPGDGLLYLDTTNTAGVVGDKVLVNGVIQPYFQVARRKYRFRFLNAGPSRFYQLFLSQYLHADFQRRELAGASRRTADADTLGAAERIDVIIDFSKSKIGDQICLENRLRQTGGPSRLMSKAKECRCCASTWCAMLLTRAVCQRCYVNGQMCRTKRCVVRANEFIFNRGNGMWTVNGRPYKDGQVVAHVERNWPKSGPSKTVAVAGSPDPCSPQMSFSCSNGLPVATSKRGGKMRAVGPGRRIADAVPGLRGRVSNPLS